VIVQRQRVVAVPETDEALWASSVTTVRSTRLARELHHAAKDMVAVQSMRGERFVETAGIHAYGPFPSLVDVETLLTGDVDERHYHGVVDATRGGYGLYLINADFMIADQPVGAL